MNWLIPLMFIALMIWGVRMSSVPETEPTVWRLWSEKCKKAPSDRILKELCEPNFPTDFERENQNYDQHR